MWDRAFLAQARSDWEIYRLLDREKRCERCHCLHYFQMTTEKLSKAILSRGKGGGPLEKLDHYVFVKMLRNSMKHPRRYAVALGLDDGQYKEIVQKILLLAEAVEDLSPSRGAGRGPNPQRKVNAEYPWETPDGRVVAPAQHSFGLAGELRSAKGRRLQHLVRKMLEEFDAL